MADAFLFYKSFFETIEKLPSKKLKNELLNAIISYGLDEIEPDLAYPLDIAFVQIRATIDSAKNRYNACVENGKKGGRPKTAPDSQKQGFEKPKGKPEQKPEVKPNNNQKGNPNKNINKNKNLNVNDNSYSCYSEVGGETLDGSPPPSGVWMGGSYAVGDRWCRDYRADDGEIRTVAYGQSDE